MPSPPPDFLKLLAHDVRWSLVTAPYGVGNRVLGVLGVVGPTRMAYERVIPVVQATAQIISGALKRAQPAS